MVILLREVYVLLSDNPCLGLMAMCTTQIRLVKVLLRIANLSSLVFPSVIWVLVLTSAPRTKSIQHLKSYRPELHPWLSSIESKAILHPNFVS